MPGLLQDFDERFSSRKAFSDLGKQRRDLHEEQTIPDVAATNPDHGNRTISALPSLEKIRVLGHHDPALRRRDIPDVGIGGVFHSEVFDMDGVEAMRREKTRESRRQLRVNDNLHGSGSAQDGVIHGLGREQEARRNVFALQVGIIFQNLVMGRARCQLLQHIDDANAHPANTRTPAALVRVESDAREQFRIHVRRLRAARLFASARFQSGGVSAGERIEDFVHLFLLRRRRMSL